MTPRTRSSQTGCLLMSSGHFLTIPGLSVVYCSTVRRFLMRYLEYLCKDVCYFFDHMSLQMNRYYVVIDVSGFYSEVLIKDQYLNLNG